MTNQNQPEQTQQLTPALIRVLQYAANGYTYKEIANRLNKSLGTIRKQASSAQKRLQARTITHAVCIAHILRIINIDNPSL